MEILPREHFVQAPNEGEDLESAGELGIVHKVHEDIREHLDRKRETLEALRSSYP